MNSLPLIAEVLRERLCLNCGYDLRGTPGEICPECGRGFDRSLGTPNTPWLARRGWRVVSFWRTVTLATFRPRRIADDAVHPADFPAAFRFRRWLGIWLAVWPMLAAALVYADDVWGSKSPQSLLRYWLSPSIPGGRWTGHWTSYVEAGCVGIVVLTLWLWVHLCLGVPSYFAHPKRLPIERQDAAIALSYYAAAPLAWLPVVLIGVLIAELFTQAHAAFYAWRLKPSVRLWEPGNFEPTAMSLVTDTVACVVAAYILFRAIRSTAVLVRRTTHGGAGRSTLAVGITLLAWPVLFVLFPVATAAALIVLQIVAFSRLT